MKRIFFAVAILFAAVVASAQNKTVTLSGKLINFSNQVEVEDMSEFQYLEIPSSDRLIIPDSTGKFNITFALSAPNYFRVGRNILYLTPGDKMEVVIDKNDPNKGSFIGKGAAANNYLRGTPFPKGGSFLEASKNLMPTPKETLTILITMAALRQKQLDETTGVSPEFKRLESARVKADLLCSINAVNSYAPGSKKIGDQKEYMKAFAELAAETKAKNEQNFIDASLMKMVVYRDVAEDMIASAPVNADSKKIKDFYLATDITNRMVRENDKAKLAGYRKSIDSIGTIPYRQAVTKHLNNLMAFGKGDVAVDFTGIDLNGKKVSLSQLKGKVIYVDLWATWCGPCLAEMPKLDEIKAKYRDNPNVVFLSISIDDDNQRDNWKKNVAQRKANGYQWQIDRNKLAQYNVTTIPRTLLIDKNFKVVSMSAPLPSAKNLSSELDKLLN